MYKTILPERAASFIARQDATASRSVPPVRLYSQPTKVASRSSRNAWWGGPGPKPAVRAVSISSKQCSNNPDIRMAPLGHTVGHTVVSLARPRRQRPFIAPRESFPLPPPVETTSDGDDTIDYFEQLQKILVAVQADLVNGWATGMETPVLGMGGVAQGCMSLTLRGRVLLSEDVSRRRGVKTVRTPSQLQEILVAIQTEFVDGWVAGMERVAFRSMLPGAS
ncbi:hypothetical protein AZE42_05841 [Rhizopogon vesiculosus]|uniref:Uncharacterized protein n=1 Tax=Rhizopogon vesiculosus TaxID=180088 RepID=A0A1J8QNB1_9AGAM|nr:hypothetical protein AZE42_05841 [Rhizopogon vesiculosus]